MFLLFGTIPLIVVNFICLEILEELALAPGTYFSQRMDLFSAVWMATSVAMVFWGPKIGMRVMRRFYTREEMYEILAGPLRLKPLRPRQGKSLDRKLDRLYR